MFNVKTSKKEAILALLEIDCLLSGEFNKIVKSLTAYSEINTFVVKMAKAITISEREIKGRKSVNDSS